MDAKIEFSLYGNACDSLDQAVDLLTIESGLDLSTKYKRAILAIYHALELLLKDRLRAIHPALVWENVESFPDLSSRTVGSEKAIVRLKNIGGLVFTDNQEKIIKSLRRTRNAIEHYTWSISKEEAEHIIGNGLGLVICFAKKYLNRDMLDFEKVKDGLLSELMWSNPRFENAYNEIKKEFETTIPPNMTMCDVCKSYVVVDDEYSCPKCGHWNRPQYLLQRSFNEMIDVEGIDDDIPF